MKNFEQPSNDGLLSKEEAMLYQEYATKLENKEYSEQANEESYEEAEKLLEKLKESKFDWLQIDWDNIDFKNPTEIIDLEKRLDAAVRSLGDEQLTNEAKSGILNKIKESAKGIVLPLTASVAILLSANITQGQEYNQDYLNDLQNKRVEYYDNKPFKIEENITDRTAMLYFDNAVYEWAEKNPEIAKKIEAVFIDNVDSSNTVAEGEGGENFTVFNVTATAKLIILTKDKKAVTLSGEYSGQEVESKSGIGETEEIIKTGVVCRQAINSALEKMK